MSEEMIIAKCAPTLAGLKTANLFSCRYTSKDTLWAEIRSFNRVLSKKGVVMLPVKASDGFALIYLYRPKSLEKDLKNEAVSRLLRRFGYPSDEENQCMAELIRRLRNSSDFPHEVGLFLGYPPEDVQGFIDNQAKNCKLVGYWKVYGDVNEAQERFSNYRRCTRIYQEQYRNGKNLHQLTVSIA